MADVVIAPTGSLTILTGVSTGNDLDNLITTVGNYEVFTLRAEPPGTFTIAPQASEITRNGDPFLLPLAFDGREVTTLREYDRIIDPATYSGPGTLTPEILLDAAPVSGPMQTGQAIAVRVTSSAGPVETFPLGLVEFAARWVEVADGRFQLETNETLPDDGEITVQPLTAPDHVATEMTAAVTFTKGDLVAGPVVLTNGSISGSQTLGQSPKFDAPFLLTGSNTEPTHTLLADGVPVDGFEGVTFTQLAAYVWTSGEIGGAISFTTSIDGSVATISNSLNGNAPTSFAEPIGGLDALSNDTTATPSTQIARGNAQAGDSVLVFYGRQRTSQDATLNNEPMTAVNQTVLSGTRISVFTSALNGNEPDQIPIEVILAQGQNQHVFQSVLLRGMEVTDSNFERLTDSRVGEATFAVDVMVNSPGATIFAFAVGNATAFDGAGFNWGSGMTKLANLPSVDNATPFGASTARVDDVQAGTFTVNANAASGTAGLAAVMAVVLEEI